MSRKFMKYYKGHMVLVYMNLAEEDPTAFAGIMADVDDEHYYLSSQDDPSDIVAIRKSIVTRIHDAGAAVHGDFDPDKDTIQ